MKCANCGRECEQREGALDWEDDYHGLVRVNGLAFYECPQCHERLLPPAAGRKIDEACKEKLDEWLLNWPLKSFMTGRQVIRELGISRQALNNCSRYRNLLYGTKIDGKWLYLKQSVMKLKQTGDGRLTLRFHGDESGGKTVPPGMPGRKSYDSACCEQTATVAAKCVDYEVADSRSDAAHVAVEDEESSYEQGDQPRARP